MDFLITSSQTWEYEVQTTIKNTALELSNKHRVIYLNTPLDMMTRWRMPENAEYHHRQAVLRGDLPLIRKENERLWIVDCPFTLLSVNKLPGMLFKAANWLNGVRLVRYVRSVLKELMFDDVIHLMDTDIYRGYYFKELLSPRLSVYYCRDYVIGQSYFARHGEKMENQLAAKSDLVLANSTYFAERFKRYNPNTVPIETGVNVELYDSRKQHPMPADMADIPRPVIGYTGVLFTLRLDIELMYEWAKLNPDKSFVLVGPEDDAFKAHALHQLSNVHFLGNKAIEELPAYIQHFDVCINPQAVNDVTIGNYPLKIDEYLCMGKPVIATRTHTMQDVFAGYTHLASSIDEYQQCLTTALSECGDQTLMKQRIELGESHSWKASVAKIVDAVTKTLNSEKT